MCKFIPVFRNIRILTGVAKLLGALAAVLIMLGLIATTATAEQAPAGALQRYHLVVPGLARSPEPTPTPYVGPIVSLDIPGAGVSARWPVEERGTTIIGGTEYLQDPSSPDRIAWYPRYGRPGFRSANTVFAAHVNYVGWPLTPFASVGNLKVDDSLYITMADGTVYTYSVKTITVMPMQNLHMRPVMFPALDSNTEQVTLITCGGDFFVQPGVGGEYDSRLIVTATRYIPD